MIEGQNTGAQTFQGFPEYVVRTRYAALRELARPCSRFASPFSTDERIKLFITDKLAGQDILDNVSYVTAPGVPLNWQMLVHYLFKKGVLKAPQFEFVPVRNDLPKAWHMQLLAKRDPGATAGKNLDVYGFSCALYLEVALSKCVGETLERFFLTQYQTKMITNATHAQLLKNGKRALNPAQLNSYLPWQKAHDPRFRYTEDAMISWVEGEFYDGRKVFLPAAAVFWNFDYRHDANEPVLVESTTNGAGAHFTREGAILSGVLENIQRDGFLVYWMNGISPRHIDVADIQDEASRDVLARLARYGIEAHFLNTTSDIAVPSVTCALVDRRTDTPVLSIGAGTGFTLEETIASSALESLAVMHYTMDLPEFHLPKDYKPFLDSSVGQNQRRSLWKGKEMLEKFSFFLSGEKQSLEDFQKQLPDLSTEQERLTYVTNLLKQKGEGYELYVYDVHNEVLDALHYHVVRTLVPRLVPLYLQENYALLDSARLREVPQLLGYEVTKTFNPAPHPFP